MTAPEVSVILPAYNAAATLPAQLAALAAQVDAPSFEVIVSDNGSEDLTGSVAHDHASAFASLTVVDSSARRGPSAARNAGAAMARGRRLAFCDADDVVSTGWLAALSRALDAADAVAGAFEHQQLNPPGAVAVSWSTDVPIRLASWPELPAGASSNLAITTAAFRDLGGFDEDLATCEDIDLCWRVQLSGYTLAFAHDAIVHERKRSGLRATYRQSVAYARGTLDLEAKHRARLGSMPFTSETGGEADGGASDALEDRCGIAPLGSTTASSEAGHGTASTGRLAALARRLRRHDRASLIADLAWRLGQRSARRTRPGRRAGKE